MNRLKRSSIITYLYAVLALIAGPQIFLSNYSSSVGGGDCYANVWGNTSLAQRIIQLDHIRSLSQNEALAVVAIGLVILVFACLNRVVLPIVTVLIILVIYGLLIWVNHARILCGSA